MARCWLDILALDTHLETVWAAGDSDADAGMATVSSCLFPRHVVKLLGRAVSSSAQDVVCDCITANMRPVRGGREGEAFCELPVALTEIQADIFSLDFLNFQTIYCFLSGERYTVVLRQALFTLTVNNIFQII